jgi:hypothetical protein
MKHVAVPIELIFEPLAGEPVRLAGALNERAARSRFSTHEQRHTDGAVIADHRDLGGRPIAHHVQQRDDRIRREIDVPQCGSRLVQNHAERHGHEFQVREQPLTLQRGQRIEDLIVTGVRKRAHLCASVGQCRTVCAVSLRPCPTS